MAHTTIERATVVRGGCIFTNESIGKAFKNRNAGSSQIEQLDQSDWMCYFIYQQVRKKHNEKPKYIVNHTHYVFSISCYGHPCAQTLCNRQVVISLLLLLSFSMSFLI